MARSTQEKEERKLTLPVGHPDAGYVSPDLSGVDGVELFPEEEQKVRDEREKAREEEAEAVAEHEDEVARKEIADREKETKEAEKSSDKGKAPAAASS